MEELVQDRAIFCQEDWAIVRVRLEIQPNWLVLSGGRPPDRPGLAPC